MENLQKRYSKQNFQLPNPLLIEEIILDKGMIIPDKEELVYDKEREISFLKKKGDSFRRKREGFSKPSSINQKDLHNERDAIPAV